MASYDEEEHKAAELLGLQDDPGDWTIQVDGENREEGAGGVGDEDTMNPRQSIPGSDVCPGQEASSAGGPGQGEDYRESNLSSPSSGPPSAEVEEMDRRSVYVGQVDYGCTLEELRDHFNSCGPMNRITLMVNQNTGQPKGYAYIEFTTLDGAYQAVKLDGSVLRGRHLKVNAKRTNIPGVTKTTGFARRGRGHMAPPFGYPFAPFGVGRGRGFSSAFRGTGSRSRWPRRGRFRGGHQPAEEAPVETQDETSYHPDTAAPY